MTPNKAICPTNKECHSLSYFNNNFSFSQTENITLIFLSGEYEISKGGFQLHGLHNVTLIGQGQLIQGFHDVVKQTTVIIRCVNNMTAGISIHNTTNVHVEGLTIANCYIGLHIVLADNVYLRKLSVQNNTNVGLGVKDIRERLTLEESSFSQNGNLYGNTIGNAYILLYGFAFISNCNFSFGISVHYTGGLYIQTKYHGNYTTSINHCVFISNIGYDSGGLIILSRGDDIMKNSSGINKHYTIKNSRFVKNVGAISGGALIKLFTKQNIQFASLLIQQTTFTDNYVTVGSEYSSGGGLVIINDKLYANCSITIDSCYFNANSGGITGGIYLSVYISLFTLVINNVTLTNNIALKGPNMAVSVGSLTVIVVAPKYGTIKIDNCYFAGNVGKFSGGALLNTNIQILSMTNTTFKNNSATRFGGAFDVGTVDGDINLTNVKVISNYQYELKVPTLQQQPHAISITCKNKEVRISLTDVHIHNNFVTGLSINGCYVQFTDKTSVIANNRSPTNGGGIYADINSVLATDGAKVYFMNNTARFYGGAIYSEQNLIGNHVIFFMCTFVRINATFSDNYAQIAGNDVYGGKYFYCSVVEFNPYHSIIDSFLEVLYCNDSEWTILKGLSRPLSLAVSSESMGVCLCSNDNIHTDCYTRVVDKVVYPGATITLSLVTVGLCGSISPGVVVTSSERINITFGEESQATSSFCKPFSYKLKQLSSSSNQGQVSIKTSKPFQLVGAPLTINVTFLKCPSGLQLDPVLGECVCNSFINELYFQCNMLQMPHPIKRSEPYWVSYNEDNNCTMAIKNCPLDYCDSSLVYFNLDDPDLQCLDNRSGILCGQCQPGLSLMLGSNRCSLCENKFLSLMILFVVAGIVLVIGLLALNMTVSVGTISGLLFYANIVKLNEAVLFPKGCNVPVLTQFISWLNLDFGIETCFFNGLDGYWKTWLQFLFPLYIWLLIIIIIIGCRYSFRLSRLCGNNAVPVLATLILMSYSKVLRTVTGGLMMTKINCSAGDRALQWYAWSVDSNVAYFSGKHIVMFIASMIFLVFGLIYTGLVFSSQWLQRYSGKCFKSSRDPVIKLKPLIDAYSGPYKDSHRYWPGLLLFVRLILTAVFSYTTGSVPQLNNYIIGITVIVLIARVNGVYRDGRLTLLELFYLINLGIISKSNALSTTLGLKFSYYVNITSISFALLGFIVTVLIHIYMKTSQKAYIKKLFFKQKYQAVTEESSDHSDEDLIELDSPSRVITRREPLIFDFNLLSNELLNK